MKNVWVGMWRFFWWRDDVIMAAGYLNENLRSRKGVTIRLDVTRTCIARGVMMLPGRHHGIFPDGDVTIRDSHRDQDVELLVHRQRELHGLQDVLQAYEAKPNDTLVLEIPAQGRPSLHMIIREHRPLPTSAPDESTSKLDPGGREDPSTAQPAFLDWDPRDLEEGPKPEPRESEVPAVPSAREPAPPPSAPIASTSAPSASPSSLARVEGREEEGGGEPPRDGHAYPEDTPASRMRGVRIKQLDEPLATSEASPSKRGGGFWQRFRDAFREEPNPFQDAFLPDAEDDASSTHDPKAGETTHVGQDDLPPVETSPTPLSALDLQADASHPPRLSPNPVSTINDIRQHDDEEHEARRRHSESPTSSPPRAPRIGGSAEDSKPHPSVRQDAVVPRFLRKESRREPRRDSEGVPEAALAFLEPPGASARVPSPRHTSRDDSKPVKDDAAETVPPTESPRAASAPEAEFPHGDAERPEGGRTPLPQGIRTMRPSTLAPQPFRHETHIIEASDDSDPATLGRMPSVVEMTPTETPVRHEFDHQNPEDPSQQDGPTKGTDTPPAEVAPEMLLDAPVESERDVPGVTSATSDSPAPATRAPSVEEQIRAFIRGPTCPAIVRHDELADSLGCPSRDVLDALDALSKHSSSRITPVRKGVYLVRRSG